MDATIIGPHLQNTTFVNNPLSPNQHAFRKGFSTESALSNMTEYIERAVIKNKVCLGVFLDIQGAFDNIMTTSIIKGMEGKNIDNTIITWYKHFLMHRSINIEYKGTEITKYLTKGTPQGGVLSPIAWNLGFDSLLDIFPDNGRVNIVGFADDGALCVSANNPAKATKYMQSAIKKVIAWGKKNKLNFAPGKTYAVMFTRKRYDSTQYPKIYMGNHVIEYVKQV